MSLNALSSSPSTALPTVNFHPRGHRKGATTDKNSPFSTSDTGSTSNSASGVTIGQLPIGASTPLFNNILQSLQQTVGTQIAVTAVPPAGTGAAAAGSAASSTPAGATTGTAANVQAFMHSLFQALKQDGLGTGATSGTASGANLLSSLKTLAGQVGSGAAAGGATASVTAAYQNLVNGAGAGAAAASAGAGATPSSAASLQNFLGNLVQNLQAGGVHALSSIGNNVNAKV
jgi:hypothetical protein